MMIGAVVLAAGLSRRMGEPKMLLPWGERTVLGQVIHMLDQGGVDVIRVVMGGARKEVEHLVQGLPAQTVFNPRYREDSMALSLQVGINALPKGVDATLVALGDQPQIEPEVVAAVIDAYRLTRSAIVVPSYRMRRGHPWLVDRALWGEIQSLEAEDTLRDFLNRMADRIHYLTVDTASVLQDLDTPDDYRRAKPEK